MPHTIADDELRYQELLTKHIRHLVGDSSTPLSLYDIIRSSAGASPVDVVQILDQQGISYFTNQWATKLPPEYDLSLLAVNAAPSLFAASHPADYDWRFTQQTVDILASFIREYRSEFASKVALFGVHTLYDTLSKLSIDVALFNKSRSLLEDLRKIGYEYGLIEFDLFHSATGFASQFGIVVADPPWYIEHYEAFIARSGEVLGVGGYLLISVIPELTRPSAYQDREEIMLIAQQCGFELLKQYNNLLEYETPVFEQVAFATHGLLCTNWRAGDLWILQKNRQVPISCVVSSLDPEPAWCEFRIGNRKIKVKQLIGQSEAAHFDYEPADPSGRYFTNTSRRSPLRNRIDVWTSDNLAYSVTQTSVLMQCLTLIEQHDSIDTVALHLHNSPSVLEDDRVRVLQFLSEIT